MVQNYFEIVVQKLIDLGFYAYFFPFVLTVAIVWALLTKSKVLGENPVMIGALSLIAGALVLGFPIITGMQLAQPISVFFTQTIVVMLVFVVIVLLSSIFHPKILDFLGTSFFKEGNVWHMIVIAIGLLIISGLVSVLWAVVRVPLKAGEVPGAPSDVTLLAAALMIFVVLIFIAGSSK